MASPGSSYKDAVSGLGGGVQSDKGLVRLRQAYASGHFDRGTVSPFQKVEGESLPRGSFRNVDGLLVRGAVSFILNSDDQRTVAQEIPFLEEHVVIAYIVDGALQGDGVNQWWAALREIASPGAIHFHRKVGPRCVYIRTDGKITTHRILAHAFHQFTGGAMIYQRWQRGFNPTRFLNVTWPMWISFLDLPLEYHKLARRVAKQVGQVLSESHEGGFDAPPRFCVGLELNKGWISNVIGCSEAGGSASIKVQYEGLTLSCLHCGDHHHSSHGCGNSSPWKSDSSPSTYKGGTPPSSNRPSAQEDRDRRPPNRATPGWQSGQPAARGQLNSHYYRRRRRPHHNRNQASQVKRPQPDADGFISVVYNRRRPSLFDSKHTGASDYPSSSTPSPPRAVIVPPAHGTQSKGPQFSGHPTDTGFLQPSTMPTQAGILPQPTRRRQTGWDVGPNNSDSSGYSASQPSSSTRRSSGWDVRPVVQNSTDQTGLQTLAARQRQSGWDVGPSFIPLYSSEDSPQAAETPVQHLQPQVTLDHADNSGDVVMTDESSPHLDTDDPLNDTSRSSDHYSNGESRDTPPYEWNGWKRTYRTKKPSRGLDQPSSSPPEPHTETGSRQEAMEVDRIEQSRPAGVNIAARLIRAAMADPRLNQGRGLINSETDSNQPGQDQGAQPVPPVTGTLSHHDQRDVIASSLTQQGESALLDIQSIRGTPLNQDSRLAQGSDDLNSRPSLMHPASTLSQRLDSPRASDPSRHNFNEPIPGDDDFFEDAAHSLPSRPASPTAIRRDLAAFLDLELPAQGAPQQDPSEGPSCPQTAPEIPSSQITAAAASIQGSGLDSAAPPTVSSIRGLRAAARMRTQASNTRSPSYDVWGFRRSISDGAGEADSPTQQ